MLMYGIYTAGVPTMNMLMVLRLDRDKTSSKSINDLHQLARIAAVYERQWKCYGISLTLTSEMPRSSTKQI